MTRVRLQAPQLAAAEPDPDHPAWIMMPSIPGSPPANSAVTVHAGSDSGWIADSHRLPLAHRECKSRSGIRCAG